MQIGPFVTLAYTGDKRLHNTWQRLLHAKKRGVDSEVTLPRQLRTPPGMGERGAGVSLEEGGRPSQQIR